MNSLLDTSSAHGIELTHVLLLAILVAVWRCGTLILRSTASRTFSWNVMEKRLQDMYRQLDQLSELKDINAILGLMLNQLDNIETNTTTYEKED